MNNTRVLHISETFAGGVYLYIRDICRYTEENENVEHYIIFSGKRKDTEFNKFSKDFSSNIKLIQVEMKREISPLNDLKAVLKISKLIKEISPNVIHLHSSKAGAIGRIAAFRYQKAKLFYTPNGYSFLRKDISKFKQSMFKIIEFTLNKFFGGITIACGDTEFKHSQKTGKSVLIRNSVNINEILKYRVAKESDKLIIGTVGRISPQKNPILFNDIAKKFNDIEFVWIGDGKLKNNLTSGNIKITGWIPRESVLKKVNEFDIYLQTSLWEGLPFSIIEAMVLKRPIIATNVIGNKDAVTHEKNGFLCETVCEFESAIKKLIEDVSMRKDMGNQSFIIANELFNKNKNLARLYEFYLK